MRLLPSIRQIGAALVAITDDQAASSEAGIVIDIGSLQEACSLGLAPSTSTTAMLAVGDALALVASRMRGFSRDDFARFHPGGSLGENWPAWTISCAACRTADWRFVRGPCAKC